MKISRQDDCTNQMREIYEQFTPDEISRAFALIRAEKTKEELRNKCQVELLEKQALLDAMK